MWHTHREPWFGVEWVGYYLASTGCQVVSHGNLSGKPTFSSVLLTELNSELVSLWEDLKNSREFERIHSVTTFSRTIGVLLCALLRSHSFFSKVVHSGFRIINVRFKESSCEVNSEVLSHKMILPFPRPISSLRRIF